jgi:hypothetical protein
VSRGSSLWLTRILTWLSTACCLVLVASFGVFAVNQSHAASQAQVQALETGTAEAATAKGAAAGAHKSTLHRVLDEAAEALRSPFSGVASASHSEWVKIGLATLLALLFYGVVLRFLARVLRVRMASAG